MNFRASFLALFPVFMALAFAPALHAGASNKNGNPFSNGSFFPNSGTFSAIARGNNGFLGVFQFSTSTSNSVSSSNSGIATVYANGQQFAGNTFGVIDSASSQISATYLAGYTYSAYVTNTTTNVTQNTQDILGTRTNVFDGTAIRTNYFITNVTLNSFNDPVYSNIVSTNFSVEGPYNVYDGTNIIERYYITNITYQNTPIIIGYTNYYVTNITERSDIIGYNQETNVFTVIIGSTNVFTTNTTPSVSLQTYSNTLSGQFTATLQNSYPNQIFSGSGQATILNLVDGTVDNYPNSVQGSRLQVGQ